MKYKLGFIGGGNMASAIISSVLEEDLYSVGDICIFDKDEEKKKAFFEKGFSVSENAENLVKNSETVFLAVKPQNLREVLEEISPSVTVGNVIVSIVAGASISFIKSILGKDTKVVRVMPNMPLKIGMGASVLAYEMPITYKEFIAVKNIFEAGGIAETVEENIIDEMTSVSGSGPAYVYSLMLSMINGAMSQGIDRKLAEEFVMKTVSGAVKVLEKTGEDVETALQNICSPKGTTLAALDVFDKQNFNTTVCNAMLACTKRASELGKTL